MVVRLDQLPDRDLSRSPVARSAIGSNIVSNGFSRLESGGNRLAGAIDNEVNKGLREIEIEKQKRERELEEQKRAQNAARAATVLSKFEIESAEDLSASAEAYDGQSDFSGDIESRLTERRARLLEEIGDDSDLRALVEPRLTAASTKHQLASMSHERTMRSQMTIEAVSDNVDISANAVLSGVMSVEKAIKDLPILLAAVPEADRDAVHDQSVKTLMMSHIQYRIGDDTLAFKKDLNEGEYDELLPADLKRATLKAVDQAIKSDEIEARRIARQLESDRKALERERKAAAREARAIEQAELQYELGDHIASIGATGKGLEDVSYERVLKAFGAKRATKFLRQEKDALQVFEALDGMASSTPEEIAAKEASLKPVPGQEGFANKQRIFAQYQSQKRQIMKARDQDPAAFAAQSGALGELASQGFGDGSQPIEGEAPAETATRVRKSRQLYLEGIVAAQERMGIERKDQRVLSNAIRDNWIERLTEGSAVEKRDAAASLSEAYGNYTGTVLEELKSAGLPDGYDVMIDLTDRDPNSAALLADGLSNKKELSKLIDKDDRKSLADAAESDLEPLFDTMLLGPAAPQEMESFKQAYQVIAQQRMSRGESLSQARKGATQDILSGYRFEGSYRLPAHFADTTKKGSVGGVKYALSGARLVESGMEAIAADLDRGLDGAAGNQNLTEENRRKIYADAIRAGGVWITEINDDGLEVARLVLQNHGRAFPVRDRNGDFVEYSFEDLAELGAWHVTRQKKVSALGRPGELQLMGDLVKVNHPPAPFRLGGVDD